MSLACYSKSARSKRMMTSLAALAILLAFSSPQLSSAKHTSTDPPRHSFYGDPCSIDSDCNFNNSICDEMLKTCKCHPDVPISNYIDKCGKAASINETCMFNQQCQDVVFMTECKNERCACQFEIMPKVMVDGSISCTVVRETTSDPPRHRLYGDPCSVDSDCNFNNSICDEVWKTCQCHPDVPISNYKDKCGKAASFNETCMFNEQCEDVDFKTECKNESCACKFEMVPEVLADGSINCTSVKAADESIHTLDSTMMRVWIIGGGTLVGIAVTFIIYRVVLEISAQRMKSRRLSITPYPCNKS